MLDSLEKGGVISRRTDAANRRADLIKLTAKGLRATQAWQKHCAEIEQVMLSGFSDEEKKQFSSYLARAYQNMKPNNP